MRHNATMNLRVFPLAIFLAALPIAVCARGDDTSVTAAAVDGSADTRADTGVPLADIQRFVSVYRAVQQGYVDPLDDRKVMRAALRGLLTDLDPHSAYLDASEARDMDDFANGRYDGVGVELMQLPDRSLRVIAPIDDSPAARAGLRPGDVIIAIDGKPIEGDSAEAGRVQLRGKPGSEVTLRVVREGEPAPLDLVLKRDVIHLSSVRGRRLDGAFAYLRISSFQGETGADLRKILDRLRQENGEPLCGLILDLRSNPGGVLGVAVEVADAFLDAGLIVSTRGRMPFANSQFNATPGDLLDGAPIVVLIDGGTASAAEVVAAALRDHGRAVLMGGRSFGKGTVQTVIPLDNGDAIKLTTARYYTPSGGSIQARGLRPDIALKPLQYAEQGDHGEAYAPREADLSGHLDAGGDASATSGDIPVAEVASAHDAQPETFADDYAIGEALAVLKGICVLRQPR